MGDLHNNVTSPRLRVYGMMGQIERLSCRLSSQPKLSCIWPIDTAFERPWIPQKLVEAAVQIPSHCHGDNGQAAGHDTR